MNQSIAKVHSPWSKPSPNALISSMQSVIVVIGLISFGYSLPVIPPPELGTWDLSDAQMEMFKKWSAAFSERLSAQDWNTIDPRDYIHHDKFNIADGFGADLFLVEKMQNIGDPVLKVENEMNEIRSKREKAENDKARSKKRFWLA